MDLTHIFPYIPPIILIDLDNTIADLDCAVKKRMEEKHPEIEWPPRTEFEYHTSITQETRNILQEPGLFLSLPIIKDAVESIQEMKDEGYQIFFCSSSVSQYDPCVKEKFQWIDKYFGKDATRRLIIAKDKTLICGDYLIDDKIQTGVVEFPMWKQIIFHQPYNTQYHGLRMENWKDWRSVIKSIKKS
jgi:5'-nucleotidase